MGRDGEQDYLKIESTTAKNKEVTAIRKLQQTLRIRKLRQTLNQEL